MVRRSRARSNRIVSCGSQASEAVAPTASRHVDGRVRFERAVDLFRRGGGDDEPRARLDGHIECEAVAAGHAARGVDDDRLELG